MMIITFPSIVFIVCFTFPPENETLHHLNYVPYGIMCHLNLPVRPLVTMGDPFTWLHLVTIHHIRFA